MNPVLPHALTGRLLPHPPPPRPAVTRRGLLRALALAGGAVLLAGCDEDADREASPTGGVEPDDPATWPADTHLLLSARQRVHGYRLGLELVGGGPRRLLAQLDDLWRTQQERLELLITLGGVPLPELHDQPAVTLPATPGDDGAGSTASASPDGEDGQDRPRAVDLGRALRADRTQALRELSTATPTNLLLLASLCAQHVASADRLGAPTAWEPMAGPAGAAAVPVLAATRPAVFGLEVVAARSAPGSQERTDYEVVLGSLRGISRQLSTLAGETAPVAPLGYDLPEPLATGAQRADLARRLVSDVAPAALDAAQRVPGDLPQLTGVVRVVSDAVLWEDLLGGEADPFPGMTLP